MTDSKHAVFNDHLNIAMIKALGKFFRPINPQPIYSVSLNRSHQSKADRVLTGKAKK